MQDIDGDGSGDGAGTETRTGMGVETHGLTQEWNEDRGGDGNESSSRDWN